MRKLLYIPLLLFSCFLQGNVSPDSLYIKAGNEYEDGKYEDALLLYNAIVENGFESPELYYNMGNAAFRSNKLGYSILYYQKALKLDPSDEEIQKNLAYVSVYKEDQLDNVPEIFLKTWITGLYHLLPLNVWSYLALAFFAFFLLGILIYIFASNLGLKKTGFFTGALALLLFIISFTGALNRNKEMTQPENAVIVAPSVLVKSSPSLSGTDLFILHEGTLIKVDDTVGEWVEIRISDGRVGWIPADSNEII